MPPAAPVTAGAAFLHHRVNTAAHLLNRIWEEHALRLEGRVVDWDLAVHRLASARVEILCRCGARRGVARGQRSRQKPWEPTGDAEISRRPNTRPTVTGTTLPCTPSPMRAAAPSEAGSFADDGHSPAAEGTLTRALGLSGALLRFAAMDSRTGGEDAGRRRGRFLGADSTVALGGGRGVTPKRRGQLSSSWSMPVLSLCSISLTHCRSSEMSSADRPYTSNSSSSIH